MTNAEPTSTDSTSERAENAEQQPSLIAVSEENLAALLRATTATGEPEVQAHAESNAEVSEAAAPAAPAAEVKEAPVAEEQVASAPTEALESRLALFASVKEHVKEHRSDRSRAAVTAEPAPVQQQKEYPSPSLPAEAAAIRVTLPKSQPVNEAAATEMPAPSRNSLVMAGVAGALVLILGIFFLWPKGHPAAKTPPVAVAAPVDNAPLQVLAEPLGNGLINVRWNAQGAAIAQARDGRLTVTERDKTPRIMALDAAQLKIGHLTYQSTAESIQFDLEVNELSGTVAKESILSLSSPPGTAPQQTAREQAAPVKPQVITQAAPPKTQTPVTPAVQAVVEVPQPSPAKARAFVPPAAQQRRVEGAIIDAPPALANAPATPVGVSLAVPLAPVSAPPPVPSTPQQIRVESNLQAANLIKKVVPVYPLLAKSAGIEGLVRFTAVIGKDGKIQNLKLISGPSPLVDAATDAVKKWVYRPTQLNGQPVEVITQINVNFTITGTTR